MRPGFLTLLGLALWAALGARAQEVVPVQAPPSKETLRVALPAGKTKVDLYWPGAPGRAPLVVVAHGFSRDRKNMSGWGEWLAVQGFAVAVPDLPAWSDHARNGRFLAELMAHLGAGAAWKERIDPARTGFMGFSAGGLSSLLAAADTPDLAIWVGLDPVDMKGLGAKAAARLTCRTLVLTAEPSGCNAHGNAKGIIEALPHCESFKVPGATHVDAEWPTGWMAELACGESTESRRAQFRDRATEALVTALHPGESLPEVPAPPIQ